MTRLVALAAATALAALSALPASAQTYSVRFQNNSGATVYRIYSSPTHNNSWEQDLLGSNVLYSGQYLDVIINNVANCYYDVLIEWESGYQQTDTFDLCSYNQYNIN
ncbi:hypothetical protein Rumeso_03755 [Rubellimicrobium mesophilum DSM 19309]|uniref:Argininosuccinate lyase n=1 Tax=Rubellimicrobium mesophilum DSM 19309 TaxID=442562 RepID=A0A017HKL3_9RHOB|nr:hypothetical protein [Rubellimicrobium mesophilum]EYD74698.1 hypothetical protein Rumeso_03755 [Rubellimicrobium mesophilum DSM 19309]